MTAPRYAILGVLALAAVGSPAFADCTKDTECKGDRVCDAGVCRDATPPAVLAPPAACHNDKDCPGELVCEQSVCTGDTNAPLSTAAPSPPATAAPAPLVITTAGHPVVTAPDDRRWLLSLNLYIVLYPYLSGGSGLLINVPLHVEHMLTETIAAYVTPTFAFTSYGGMNLVTIGASGGARYYFDKATPLVGSWVGAGAGFATQIVGEGSFGMNILAEAGYTLGSGTWQLALGGTAGVNIPLYIENSNSSGPSGLSPNGPSFVYSLIISPGYRF